MRNPTHNVSRLFIDEDLSRNVVPIGSREAHYLGHVLRLKQGDRVVVFNGRGEERLAAISSLAKRRPELTITANLEPLAEPKLDLILIQALVKGEAMDTIVQKAAELGVRTLYAVKTDFSVIKLDDERVPRRVAHWNKVAQSACEQSGRHRPPEISVAVSLAQCLDRLPPRGIRIVCQPDSTTDPARLDREAESVSVLVGPEGGLSETDLDIIDNAGFTRTGLGPRVLRADTAAIAACSLAQIIWGDFQ
ncbi:16S rRNA (uracil(1498)-N(3))-methyltransferase [Candidatus Rariloculus sp.]|uniref:16S rRNA (uracil(1498)-N(3))-methyltransferase n=1 Tax=Candidatus Rariloculus sp. TaxID=3101265 RepID=UPI003D10C683